MHLKNDPAPRHRLLAKRLASSMLDGEIAEGDVVPSVRELAMQHLLNPDTVALALQALHDDGVLERRGQALYVKPGARERLREAEGERFLRDEWPALSARLHRLGINPDDLCWRQGHTVT